MEQICSLTSNVVNSTISTAAWTLKPLLKVIEKGTDTGVENTGKVVLRETIFSLPTEMRKWIAIAGLMGASAVAIGAYGAHVVYPRKEIPDGRKAVFEAAHKYHFLHTLALLSVPYSSKPCLTGSLFITGTVIFSGSCYYYAITDNNSVSKYAPYGGLALIAAWLSLML